MVYISGCKQGAPGADGTQNMVALLMAYNSSGAQQWAVEYGWVLGVGGYIGVLRKCIYVCILLGRTSYSWCGVCGVRRDLNSQKKIPSFCVLLARRSRKFAKCRADSSK